jgi:hypothetical protein
MTETATAKSFIVRVYRMDPDDSRQLVGQVEALDGSGECQPFADAAELTALLNRKAGKRSRKPKP